MTVVDASALAAVVFGEPDGGRILPALAAPRLCAPPLVFFELTNIALTKIRRRPGAAAAIAEDLRDGLRLPIELVPVDFAGVLELALDTGLTAYDASYLWLMRRLDARLLTLDRELAKFADLRG